MGAAFLRYSPFAVAAVLLAVLIHILSVLVLPAVAMRTSGGLLAVRAGSEGIRVLPPGAPSAATPFADPAMVTAICPFDLADGAFRIRAQMADSFTSLVILSPSGAVLHGITDKAATRRVLDVIVGTNLQIRTLEGQDPDDRPAQEIRLRVPAGQGLAVLRSLAARPSDAAAVTEILRRTQCGVAAEP